MKLQLGNKTTWLNSSKDHSDYAILITGFVVGGGHGWLVGFV